MAGAYRGFDQRNYLLAGKPTATFNESFPYDQANTDLVASLSTGVMTTVPVPMIQGDTATTVSVMVGATAVSVVSHAWAALYSTATTPALLAQSTDVTTQAAAANTIVQFTLATAQPITATGVYFVGISFTATTVPTLVGKTQGVNATNIAAFLTAFTARSPMAQTSGSALGATAPATITSTTNIAVVPYVVVT